MLSFSWAIRFSSSCPRPRYIRQKARASAPLYAPRPALMNSTYRTRQLVSVLQASSAKSHQDSLVRNLNGYHSVIPRYMAKVRTE
ncbi:hypothetical protein D3C80_1910310 [compost metagenome]